METSKRPIGWWLKHVDRLLEESFDRILADQHLGRRHWQLLNALNQGATTPADVDAALAPFWTPGVIEPAEVVDELVRRGWVTRDSAGDLALTTRGEQARSTLLERVNANRRAVMDGFNAEEYEAVVDALCRMAANLQATAAPAGS